VNPEIGSWFMFDHESAFALQEVGYCFKGYCFKDQDSTFENSKIGSWFRIHDSTFDKEVV
jgi:hypothetical protein